MSLTQSDILSIRDGDLESGLKLLQDKYGCSIEQALDVVAAVDAPKWTAWPMLWRADGTLTICADAA